MTPVRVVDSETKPFSPGDRAPRPVCLSFASTEDKGLVAGEDQKALWVKYLTEALRGGPVVAAFNAAYDCACAMGRWPDLMPLFFEAYDAGRVACLYVNELLLDVAEGSRSIPGRLYNLADVARRRLGVEMTGKDDTRLDFARLDGVPLEQWPKLHRDYAVGDSWVGLRLWEAQEERARGMAYSLPDATAQARADLALFLCTCWGMTTDVERVSETRGRLQVQLGKLAEVLVQHGLAKVGPRSGKVARSNKAMQALVDAAFGGNAPKSPKSGNAVIDADALEDVQDLIDDPEGVQAWLDFSELQKTDSTYLKAYLAGLLHPRYTSVLETGRTSCSSPNVQNISRKAGTRECLVARPGWVLISCDFDSQEMRCWAEACEEIVGRSVLAERYREDPSYDPHLALCAEQLLGIPLEEAAARKKAGDEAVKLARQSAKIPNFGLPGGMGVAGLIRYARSYGERWLDAANCEGCRVIAAGGMPGEDAGKHGCKAQRLRSAWQAQWPEQADYFAHVASIAGDGRGTMVQLYSNRRRGRVGYTDGGNGYFQGLASDASKAALWEVTRRCHLEHLGSALYGCRVWVFVHDEVIVEAPEGYAAEAAEEMRECMESAAQKWTPKVPARASVHLMRRWSKAAETSRDAGGRLIPWEEAA